jgi:predicted RNA methylase
MAKPQRENSGQLLFDFTFDDDVAEHVARAVVPRITDAESQLPSANSVIPAEAPINEPVVLNERAAAEPWGAWLSFDRRLSVADRNYYNDLAQDLIKKPADEITDNDRAVLRYYSGFGGTGKENERGVLYDYYTSPPVAGMIWRLVHKIKPIRKGSRILEPSCGTGVFFATAPRDVALAGVEIDPRTAAVARILHPAAHIRAMSFEAFNVSRDAEDNFDYVIGNAPFGERGADAKFMDMPEENSLDRYFVSRGVDALKPGGVMAVIVHPGVLDNQSNAPFRASVVRKAVFLGAVRLNDHSFAHTHTRIQPDVLFFQKHPEGAERHIALIPDDLLPIKLHGGFVKPAFNYYDLFPGHVMGVVSAGTGQWGSDEVKGRITPESVRDMVSAFDCGLTVEQLTEDKTYEAIRQSYPVSELTSPPPRETLALTADEAKLASDKLLRPGFPKVEQNAVYILSDNFRWSLASDAPDLASRVKRLLVISGNVREIRKAMRRGEDENVGLLQTRTSQFLEDYKLSFAVYPNRDARILSFIRKHPAVSGAYDGIIDPETPIITSENLYSQAAAVNGHSPAVQALYTLREYGQTATAEVINKWFPDEADNLIREMQTHPDIFLTPENKYQLREEFISGNAWEKIEELERAKAALPRDAPALARLTGYQEELRNATNWTPLEESNVTPHASWMPENIVNAFVHSDVCPRKYAMADVALAKNEKGKWGVVDEKTKQWAEYNDPVTYYLNYQKQRSKYYDTEEFNKEYNELFLSYVSNHNEYRAVIETTFNRLYNAEIKAPVKTYPIHIEGWTNAKILKGHQWQSVHHLYREEKGISALGTGFGKTLTAVALYSVLRQEGKLRRAFFQVPNNKVKDWALEISDVMPSLKVGYIDPETPGYSSVNKRYAAYHRLANSVYDILIFPESAAGEIQLSPENDEYIADNVIAKHLTEKKPRSARKTEELKDRVKESLQNGKTNKAITFEDLGCDALFVDEAHRYKNLFTSSLSRDVGLNDGRQSAKAMSLFKKAAFIRQQNNGKNVYLFTATPLTNSPLEYYNMLMYIAPEELERFSILTIDNFIRNFADIRESETYDWRNGQTARKKILAGFYNIRTLQDIFFKYTDYQNDPKSINLDKPDPVHNPHIIAKDPLQAETVKSVSQDLETFAAMDAAKREEFYPRQNYLTFYTKLRTASLDVELYDPRKFSGWRNPKLDALAKDAWNMFQKTGAGQLIFCDRVFSSDYSFNIHDKIASYLVNEGFDESQIAVVNGFTKSGAELSDEKAQKQTSQTVADFNAGKYKIIIGTTGCIGEGLNLQENSCAIHHFDIPFRPSDFIQRNGRVDRQGNNQDKVHINSYMASGTIDNYSVNLVQNKANWIDELLKSKTNVFVNKDDESSIDPNELLLALSEEWGDADKAAALREKIKRTAEEAAQKEKDARLKSSITSLSKLRAPLYNYRGDKTSFAYRQRVERINNIERALLANPSFIHKEIIGAKKPFLYSEKYDRVIMEGDYYHCYSGHNAVSSINQKSLSFNIRPLFKTNDAEYEISLRDFNPDNYVFVHSPDKNFFEAVASIDKIDFYSLEDKNIKERFYFDHLNGYSDHEPVPLILFDGENITIGYTDAITYAEKREALNPFSAASIEKIKSAATITFNPDDSKYANAVIMNKMKDFTPDVFEAVADKLPCAPPAYDRVVAITNYASPELRSAVKTLCSYPFYKNDPLLAVKTIVERTPKEDRQKLKTALVKAGCIDGASTKNIVAMWSADGRKPPAAKQFANDRVHVVGIDV